jgi:hypothetical protein
MPWGRKWGLDWGRGTLPPPPPIGTPIPSHSAYGFIIAYINGPKIAEFPTKNLEFSYILNSPGAVSCVVPLEHPLSTMDILKRGAREIWIVREGVRVWGGYLWTVEASDDGDILIGGEGWASRLKRRYVDETLTYKQVDQLDIAWSLIDFTQQKPYGNLGFTRGSMAKSGILRDRTYNDFERKQIAEAEQQLSAVNRGFDFDINPYKVWNTYYPRRGGPTNYVFVLGKQIKGISQSEDASEQANEITALGSGEGKDMVIAVAEDIPSKAEYGLLQDVRSFSDVDNQDTLNDHALEELRLAKAGKRLPQISYLPTFDLPFGAINPGDEVKLVAHLGYIQLQEMKRVTSVTVAVSNEGEESIGLFVDEELP